MTFDSRPERKTHADREAFAVPRRVIDQHIATLREAFGVEGEDEDKLQSCPHGLGPFENCQACDEACAALAWFCDNLWGGHELRDAGSYAGPESGAAYLECTRCGWAWSHTCY